MFKTDYYCSWSFDTMLLHCDRKLELKLSLHSETSRLGNDVHLPPNSEKKLNKTYKLIRMFVVIQFIKFIILSVLKL